MKSFNRIHSIKLKALTLVISSALATTLSACRIRNASEFSSTIPPDNISGFYQTAPTSAVVCATPSTASGLTNGCKVVDFVKNDTLLETLPSQLSSYITNPVALILQNESTGASALEPYYGSGSYLPIVATSSSDTSGILSLDAQTGQSPAWKSAQCLSQLFLSAAGSFSRYATRPNSPVGVPLYGALSVDIQLTTTFIGADLSTDCDASLQAMASCYQDPNQCGGTPAENPQNFSYVHQLFGPFILSGAMNQQDILKVRQLDYTVLYR